MRQASVKPKECCAKSFRDRRVVWYTPPRDLPSSAQIGTHLVGHELDTQPLGVLLHHIVW